jgi:hypothetical protein
MKDNKHIQSFNEHKENLNISDVRSSKNYKKLIKELNNLKYKDGSKVEVILVHDTLTIMGKTYNVEVVRGFKFYLTDGLEFEKKIDKVCKICGFDDWWAYDEESIKFD